MQIFTVNQKKKRKYIMSKIEQSRKYGCLHCGNPELEDLGNETICLRCGCVHDEHSYCFALSVKEENKEVAWFSESDSDLPRVIM